MNKKVFISPHDLSIVKIILAKYRSAQLFGSRVKGTHGPFSDLDISLAEPLSLAERERLDEQFEQSDLPFKVDVVMYNKTDQSFQETIKKHAIPLTEA